jgi:hypothetical protein
MNLKNLALVIVTCSLLSASVVFADVLCVKNKVGVLQDAINLKKNLKRVTGNTCPAKHTLLMDLSNLVGETGNLPKAATGKTFTGTFSTGGRATAIGDWLSDSINFPTQLANAPVPHVIEDGGLPTTECPGTFSNPSALAGHLCIYVSYQDGVANHTVWSPTTSNSDEASVYGAAIYSYATGAGRFYSWGTWAVTTN